MFRLWEGSLRFLPEFTLSEHEGVEMTREIKKVRRSHAAPKEVAINMTVTGTVLHISSERKVESNAAIEE